MCGAYAIYEAEQAKQRFSLAGGFKIKPTYNIRPSMTAPVITNSDKGRVVADMRFGLVPFWAKSPNVSYKMFNARAETLYEKTTWKRLIENKRCIIPANGFYEWQKTDYAKKPMYVQPTDQELFSFAGLHTSWHNKETGDEINSFSIITTKPNKFMSAIHDRMPVMFHKDQEDIWLSDEDDKDLLSGLLTSYENSSMNSYEVSTEVNVAKNQGQHLIEPVSTSNS